MLDSSGVSSGAGGVSEYGMGEWWVGEGLIRMTRRDIRNEEVLRDIGERVELKYNEGHVGERELYMREVVPGPWRGKHPPNISYFSLTLTLRHTRTNRHSQ